MVHGSDGNLQMEIVAALRLIEDVNEANSYDPYTCKVRDSFFYECLDIASPKTLSSSINGSYGVGVSSTAFTWLSGGLNASSINCFGGTARCHDKVTGDGVVNSFDVAVLMYYQFEMPPYDRANLPRTPAEVPTVDGRHDTWKRCETNETRTSWQLTVADDYCALSDNYTQPTLSRPMSPMPPPPSLSPLPSLCMDKNMPNDPEYCQNTVGALVDRITKCKQTNFIEMCERTCNFCPPSVPPPSPPPSEYDRRRLSTGAEAASQVVAQPANGRSLFEADVMGRMGLQVCEWAVVPGLGRWARIYVPAILITLEFFLSGFATEQGITLSNQRTPPSNCTDCAPLLTSPNEPAVTFARFLEYEGVGADRAATDCATIVGMTPEKALSKNVLSLRQQPATQACRFDIFIWIPQQPSPGVHVAAHAEAGSVSATRLAQLGATSADRGYAPAGCGDDFGVLAGSIAMDGRGGQVQREAACLQHCTINFGLGEATASREPSPPPPPSPNTPEPSPPPPPSPNSPEPSLPPSPLPAAPRPPPVVVLTMTASGSVSDYSDTTSLQSSIAAVVGVNASAVTVTVAAASVLITASIAVPASTTPAAVQTTLSSNLGTAAAASTVLSVTVLSIPTVMIVMPPPSLQSPPTPPPPPPPPSLQSPPSLPSPSLPSLPSLPPPPPPPLPARSPPLSYAAPTGIKRGRAGCPLVFPSFHHRRNTIARRRLRRLGTCHLDVIAKRHVSVHISDSRVTPAVCNKAYCSKPYTKAVVLFPYC